MFSLLQNFSSLDGETDVDAGGGGGRRNNRVPFQPPSKYESAPPEYADAIPEDEAQEELPTFAEGAVMETAIGSLATDSAQRRRDHDGGGLGVIHSESGGDPNEAPARGPEDAANKGPDSTGIVVAKYVVMVILFPAYIASSCIWYCSVIAEFTAVVGITCLCVLPIYIIASMYMIFHGNWSVVDLDAAAESYSEVMYAASKHRWDIQVNVTNPLDYYACKPESERDSKERCELLLSPFWIKSTGCRNDVELYHDDLEGGNNDWNFCTSPAWDAGNSQNITHDPLASFTSDMCDDYFSSSYTFEAHAIVMLVFFLVTPCVAIMMMNSFAVGKIKRAKAWACLMGAMCTVQLCVGTSAWVTFQNIKMISGPNPFTQDKESATITYVAVIMFLVIGPLSAGMMAGFPFSQKIFERTRIDLDIYQPIYWPKVIMERWVFEHVPAFDNYPAHCCQSTGSMLPMLQPRRRR